MSAPDKPEVLIVDDETPVRTSLTEFLEDYDYRVAATDSAESALTHLSNPSIAVVIVDLRLPGFSGEEFIKKAHELRPDLKYIIHTGSVGYSLSNAMQRIGVNRENIFHKPVMDLMKLVNCIQSLLPGET